MSTCLMKHFSEVWLRTWTTPRHSVHCWLRNLDDLSVGAVENDQSLPVELVRFARQYPTKGLGFLMNLSFTNEAWIGPYSTSGDLSLYIQTLNKHFKNCRLTW